VQYAAFGWLIARLMRLETPAFRSFLGVGALIGVVFGGILLGLFVSDAPQTPPALALVARGLNELLFPMGCATVLWVTGVAAKRMG
jgi:hypothetical protein